MNTSIKKIISAALREDAAWHDITTQTLIPKNRISQGFIVMKEEGVICGIDIARACFKRLNTHVKFQTRYKDGDWVKKNSKVIRIKGRARALLSAERTALNFLGFLSGIATHTNRIVKKIRPFKTKILDTRKTTPTLRILEKYAVHCGGGLNHRLDLSESILIKDNHKAVFSGNSKSLFRMVNECKKKSRKPIEVEVESIQELKDVLKARPDFVLLDNVTPREVKEAVQFVKKSKLKPKPLLEASGGITLKNVRDFAATGVDRISSGALTHTHQSINFSMELVS